mgnify:CR=1 FL=1
MADPVGTINFDQLSHITRKHYIPQLVDNIFKSNVVTYRLLAKSQPISGGFKVVQPVEYAKSASSNGAAQNGWYKGQDALAYGASDIIKSAEYDWSQAFGTVTISAREENINAGPEAVLDLLQAKLNNIGRTMRDDFAKAIYSDNDPAAGGSATVSANAPVGLQHVIKKDRTLGGINSASTGNEWWDGGFVADGTLASGGAEGTPLTFTNIKDSSKPEYIQTIFRNAYKELSIGADVPTMIVTNQVVFDAYESTLTDQKRFGASSTTLADAGFQNLLYRGIPVVVDQALDLYEGADDDEDAAHHMFFLNEKYMGYKHHAKRNFVFDGYEKPVDRDIRVGKILWMGTLCFSSPRMLGIVGDMPKVY